MAALFPPQNRDWALPSEANLSPYAAERVCRESAHKAFDESAKSLNIDWKVAPADRQQPVRHLFIHRVDFLCGNARAPKFQKPQVPSRLNDNRPKNPSMHGASYVINDDVGFGAHEMDRDDAN